MTTLAPRAAQAARAASDEDRFAFDGGVCWFREVYCWRLYGGPLWDLTGAGRRHVMIGFMKNFAICLRTVKLQDVLYLMPHVPSPSCHS
jgi:hypothetical protein